MPKKEDAKSVDDLIENINKKFGDHTIQVPENIEAADVSAVPTGLIGVDHILGVGGVARGRVVEIFGPESGGKSTFALQVIAQAQKLGNLCAYIDAEHAISFEYAKKLGVDTSKLLFSQPQSGEQGLSILEEVISYDDNVVAVVDSVASLVPKVELEGEMDARHIGTHARMMSLALKKIKGIIKSNNATVIFINQLRANLTGYGSPDVTPGGMALKFYSDVRIDIRRIAAIKKGEELVGSKTRIKVAKNKLAMPFKQTEVDLIYGEGFSREGELLTLGDKVGVVSKSGANYSFNKEKIGYGYDATRVKLKEDSELANSIAEAITLKLNEGK